MEVIALPLLGDQPQVGRQKRPGTAGQIVVAVVAVGAGIVLFIPAQVTGIAVVTADIHLIVILAGAFVVVRQGGFSAQGSFRAAVANVVAINGEG